MNSKHIGVGVLTCLLFASGCASRQVTPTQPAPVPTPDNPVIEPVVIQQPRIEPEVDIATTATTPRVEVVQSLPAVAALREQATIASTASDHARAIGLLERALRIAPGDPQTFYDLASNHLALKQPQQAMQLARRGLTLNPNNNQRDALQDLITRSQSML